MPTLVLRFPGGRYHATPWGHHVNEGVIEWPPSPWRILRALLSTGYTALGWSGSMAEPWRSAPPDVARSLILKLANTHPLYRLPPAVGAHSRHYMPLGKTGGETTLVFDTWAQVDTGELAVCWDVPLTSEEEQMLASLAQALGYLGRSESWVQARIAPASEQYDFNCWPCVDGSAAPPGRGWEQVSVLTALTSAAYDAWRTPQVEAALSPHPLPEGKRAATALLKKRDAVQAPYPADLLACLQVDTPWLRGHGWSQPPGSQRVLYWRRADALQAAPRSGSTAGSDARASFVLLALATDSGNEHALPALSRSLPQGEMLHRQAVAARLRIAPEMHPAVLTGCDANGQPLRGAHSHAHVLALDLDADGHIDHLLVWARDGLDALDQRALRHTRGTYTKGGVGTLRLAWAGAGEREDMLRLPHPFGAAMAQTIGKGRTWTSATPFVPPRHLKSRGTNTLEGQVRAELASRGLPQPDTVQWLDPQEHELARRLRHHVRRRRHGPAPVLDAGFAIQLQFSEPVQGPICLGYGSHFGLGRFEHNEPGA